MTAYSKWLIRMAALYSLIGALIGADMAGREDYAMIPVHAHILVVGWLTLFAYGIFYSVFKNVRMVRTAKLQAWTALLGGGLMPLGMLAYYKAENTATLLAFIVPASVLLVGIALFVVVLFFDKQLFAQK
ncbi:hypothetical protein B1A99_04805 [Cohnella sp. CIP 111063]|uniref:hypothetical protein n=1 Tax=unclassified Cohnella TaxID=2636738 RepID=UPI000B8C4F73|nr:MULTISPECIES: hypothetical protein [unclassified Cohnella]OXS61922.1 hypothetical protein B1A99_04805 [Cohnella sp. CIP 111063]PRX74378.1 hypothetical protein B0G52_102405 [Cohnella sp. SGD-V74]